MKTLLKSSWFLFLLLAGWPALLHAQSAAFTYQGRLIDSGSPANGLYDFNCNLYATNNGGAPLAPAFLAAKIPVTNGLFLLTLDFTPGVFNGTPLFLDLQISAASAGKFTTLAPRQPLTPAPLATRAMSAAQADLATQADTAAIASAVVPGGVNGTSLAQNSVSTGHLANNAVITTKINDGAIITTKLADNSVTTLKILDAAVTAPKIASGAVGTPQLAIGAVGSAQIMNGAVDHAQLAPNAVGSVNLMNGAVTSGQLGAGAAAANLAAGGQTAVPSGGIIMSSTPLNTQNLLNAGYVKIGALALAPESWATNLTSGPPATGALTAPRSGHTAVWTGSEMIIWGGSDGIFHNNGARYNPAGNSWTPINSNSGLSPRANHVAVWTGSLMLVWGGWGGSYFQFNGFQDGSRYNPATDTWTAMTVANVPTGRAAATAVWTGSKMLVWGGWTTDGYGDYTDVPTGSRYDPVANTWTAMSTVGAPASSIGHSAVWTGTEMIVFGGSVAGFSGGRYNPTANTWSAISTSTALTGRAYHSAVWTGTNMIIWGGYSDYTADTNNGARYNPSANTWTGMATAGAPSARDSHSAVWTGTKMIIWGGYSAYNNFNVNDGAIYDPAFNTWSAMTANNAPPARDSHTALWSGSEMIIWGGQTSYYDYYGGSYDYPEPGGRYNPALNSWATMQTAPGSGEPSARQGATAVWTGSEMIVWGGENGGFLLRTGGRYNPVNDIWNPITTQGAPSGRRNHTAVWTGSSMLVWGGTDVNGPSAIGGRYNPAVDTWNVISSSNAPVARTGHVAVWTGTEMLIWGGGSGYALVVPPPVGGRYNPVNNTWKPMSTTNQPANSSGAVAVWTGNEMVVWGGFQTSLFSTTYFGTGGRYNPVTDTWIQMSNSNAPSARTSHTAVWTGTDYIVFGGTNSTTNLNTGARYTVATDIWTPLTLSNAPAARSLHTAVWAGNQMIVFGGFSPAASANYTGTCHLYDPQANIWTASPNNYFNNFAAPRCGNHCALWTGQAMLVWGGLSDAGYLSQPYLYYPARNVDLMLRP